MSVLFSGLNVLSSVSIFTTNIVWNMLNINKLVQFLQVLGELDLRSNHWVQPVFDNVPNGGENPWGIVDENVSQTLWKVGLKDFSQELDGAVIIVFQGKSGQVEQNRTLVDTIGNVSQKQSTRLNGQHCESLSLFNRRIRTVVQASFEEEDWVTLLVDSSNVRFRRGQILNQTFVCSCNEGFCITFEKIVVTRHLVVSPVQRLEHHIESRFKLQLSCSHESQDEIVKQVQSVCTHQCLVDFKWLVLGHDRRNGGVWFAMVFVRAVVMATRGFAERAISSTIGLHRSWLESNSRISDRSGGGNKCLQRKIVRLFVAVLQIRIVIILILGTLTVKVNK